MAVEQESTSPLFSPGLGSLPCLLSREAMSCQFAEKEKKYSMISARSGDDVLAGFLAPGWLWGPENRRGLGLGPICPLADFAGEEEVERELSWSRQRR